MYSSCRGVQGGDQEHCQHVLRVKIILEDFNLPVSTLTAKLPNLTRIKFTGYMVFASSVHIATNTSSVCVQNIDLGVCYNSSHTNRQGSHSQAVQFLIAYSTQVSKSKGGRPGSVYNLNDVSVHRGRGGGRLSNDRTILRSFLAVSIQFVTSPKRL